MDVGNKQAEQIVLAVARTGLAPTLVVGLGSSGCEAAKAAGSALGTPWTLAIDVPVSHGEGGQILGVVSANDDLSFWNPILIQSLHISQDGVQQLAQQARLDGMKALRKVVSCGARTVPTLLENAVVVAVCEQACPGLRYRLCLLRQRRPSKIVLLSGDESAKDLFATGVVDYVAVIPHKHDSYDA